jgi:hypothetical protein
MRRRRCGEAVTFGALSPAVCFDSLDVEAVSFESHADEGLLGIADLRGFVDLDAAEIEEETLVRRERGDDAVSGDVRGIEELLHRGAMDREGRCGEAVEESFRGFVVVVFCELSYAVNRGGAKDGLFGDGGEGVRISGALGGDAAEGYAAEPGQSRGIAKLGCGEDEGEAGGVIGFAECGFDAGDLGNDSLGLRA